MLRITHLITLLTLVTGLVCIPMPAIAGDCAEASLSPEAANLVRPVLSAYINVHANNFKSEELKNIYDDRFYELLDNKSAAADEAIAALMRFYIGTHPSEELMCEVLTRGQKMLPYLRRFRDCIPVTGLEPLTLRINETGDIVPEAIERVESGDGPCEYE